MVDYVLKGMISYGIDEIERNILKREDIWSIIKYTKELNTEGRPELKMRLQKLIYRETGLRRIYSCIAFIENEKGFVNK